MTAPEGASKATIVPAIGLGLMALILRLIGGAWPVDDAFISFRYARNLASGLGLVYNPGQFVLGTSTPLFALLLAGLAKFSGLTIPPLAVAVSAVADAIGTFLLYGLARRLRLSTFLCVLCAVSWAFYPLSLKYALGGMETSLVSALILGAFAAWLSHRDVWAMVLAGAASLGRPDALAAAFAIAVGIMIARRAMPWRPMLAFAVIVLPWLIFATVVYGSPLAQSIQAKSHSIYRIQPLENTRQIAFQFGGIITSSLTGLAANGLILAPTEEVGRSLVLAFLILLPLWLLGAVSAVRLDPRWTPVFGFPVIFAATYAILGLRGSLVAEWYLVPLTPLWFLGLFQGLSTLTSLLKQRWTALLTLALGALFGVAQVAGLNWGREPGRPPWLPMVISTEREGQYRRAVDFLKPRLRAGDVVAASEIGAIGYYCECRILDTVGLVSPEAVRYYPLPSHSYRTNYAVPPDLIRDLRPDYFVSLDVFLGGGLQQAGWFKRDYRSIWELDTPVFGSRKLLIFARRNTTSVIKPGLSDLSVVATPDPEAR